MKKLTACTKIFQLTFILMIPVLISKVALKGKKDIKKKGKIGFPSAPGRRNGTRSDGDTALYHKGKIQLPELYTYREM